MTNEERIAQLEAQVARLTAANQNNQREKIENFLIEKFKISDSHVLMMEHALDHTPMDGTLTFQQATQLAEQNFIAACKRAKVEVPIPPSESIRKWGEERAQREAAEAENARKLEGFFADGREKFKPALGYFG